MQNFDATAAIRRSVISVPPLARRPDLTIDKEHNARILAHLRSGGVRTFMYGGNANFYHISPSEFAQVLDLFTELTVEGDWFIPAVGSDFGKALDQLKAMRNKPFPTAMVLPHRFPATKGGYAKGLRLLADAYGKPVVAYVKDDDAIEPKDLAALISDGAVCAVKYAVVLEDPKKDTYLEKILALVNKDVIISGIGERPVIDHWTHFGLRAFTSGSVCVAPALSNAIRLALTNDNVAEATRLREFFLPLEDSRDAHSPIRILHEAVRLAGIAETGPMLPMLENITDTRVLNELDGIAKRLFEANAQAGLVAVK